MKKRLAILTTAFLAMMAGCSSQSAVLTSEKQVELTNDSNSGVHVAWAEARQKGETTVITGVLASRGAGNWRRVGHVDVKLTDAQGKSVAHACSEPICVTLRGPGRGSKLKHFEVRTPAIIPADGKASVTFRYGGTCKADIGGES